MFTWVKFRVKGFLLTFQFLAKFLLTTPVVSKPVTKIWYCYSDTFFATWFKFKQINDSLCNMFQIEFFHDGSPHHIETNLLICSANQWTGYHMIGTSVMNKLTYFTPMFLFLRFQRVQKSNNTVDFTFILNAKGVEYIDLFVNLTHLSIIQSEAPFGCF